MSNNKQSSVEWLIDQYKKCFGSGIPLIMNNENEKAKAMQQEQAQQYAEFCVESDRRNLPLLDFNSWIAHNETFGGNK
jgi:acyl-[acyl carrier protein]--UDP-N-acetylglucosamine O-acyltransferase